MEKKKIQNLNLGKFKKINSNITQNLYKKIDVSNQNNEKNLREKIITKRPPIK